MRHAAIEAWRLRRRLRWRLRWRWGQRGENRRRGLRLRRKFRTRRWGNLRGGVDRIVGRGRIAGLPPCGERSAAGGTSHCEDGWDEISYTKPILRTRTAFAMGRRCERRVTDVERRVTVGNGAHAKRYGRGIHTDRKHWNVGRPKESRGVVNSTAIRVTS